MAVVNPVDAIDSKVGVRELFTMLTIQYGLQTTGSNENE